MRTVRDRALAALPYLLPLVEALPFGVGVIGLFPPLGVLFQLLLPVLVLYSLVPFGSLVIFFLLFALVVRNPRIDHFLRFHTLQALLMSIFLSLCAIALEFLGFSKPIGAGILASVGGGLGGFAPFELLLGALFVVTLAAVGFAIVKAAQGEYADLPIVTNAARNMMPY